MIIAKIQNAQGKETQLNLDMNTQKNVSRIIKISGLYDWTKMMTTEEYNQIYDDMEEELLKHGDVEFIKVIWNGQELVGAEVGSVFA